MTTKLTAPQNKFLLELAAFGQTASVHHTVVKWAAKAGFINVSVENGKSNYTLLDTGYAAVGITPPSAASVPAVKAKKAPKAKPTAAEKAARPYTTMQSLVLPALVAASDANGHDFGLLEEALEMVPELTRFQTGAIISTLIERGNVFQSRPAKITVNGNRVYMQYVLYPDIVNQFEAKEGN